MKLAISSLVVGSAAAFSMNMKAGASVELNVCGGGSNRLVDNCIRNGCIMRQIVGSEPIQILEISTIAP